MYNYFNHSHLELQRQKLETNKNISKEDIIYNINIDEDSDNILYEVNKKDVLKLCKKQ
jgi:hypothetical protein